MGDTVEAFAAIWGKATGGRAVAVDPHFLDAVEEFTVAPAPGVQEACNWLRAAIEGQGPRRMVFLVGGPGGGKSHALIQTVHGLKEDEAGDTGLAQRKYRYVVGASRLTVVNDASIRAGADRHPLADDIDQAAERGDYFLGCVNRGILVEEAHALNADSPGAAVVRWLAGVSPGPSDHPLVEVDASAVLGAARLSLGDNTIDVVAVNVDYCSLFEVRPKVDAELRADPYKVKRLKDRPSVVLESMPAGALLSTVLDHFPADSATGASGFDPIQANLESLRSSTVRSGVLTILRSAEAVAGGRMTFREVWGAILRALAGDLPRDCGPVELAGMFPTLDHSADDLAFFIEMKARARLRLSQSLFGTDTPSEVRLADPVLTFTAPVDPTLDAVPGRLQHGLHGWASPVLDAFSGLITSASPLETLLESISDNDPFRQIVTEFDRNVDKAFVAVTRPEGVDDRQRRGIVSWYGDYLSRLYAVSNGVSAFRPEVAAWLDTRGVLPSRLERELKTLLRPSRDPNDPQSGYLLPLFSSRTIPFSGAISEPQLAMKGEAVVELKHHSGGDAASVEMREGGAIVGEIELDFALIRSALACASERLGVTEQAARVGPRVERFRAKRLTPHRISGSDFRLLSGGGTSDVYVEG